MSQEVLTDISDGIMVITMNRPEAKNAMNKSMAESISAALDEMDSNDSVRVGILMGGGGTFCSGMDLKGFLAGESPFVEGRGFGGLTQHRTVKPLIAAAEGYALAGGFELMIACDLVVADKATKFGIPEVKRSLCAAAGGLVTLPKQISPRLAMELALTGDFIDAARAYEMGLINTITDSGKVLEGARELAARIAANGPLGVAASKKIIAELNEWPHDEIWARQAKITNPVFASEDAREGATAFAEKRPPIWKGK